MAKPTKTNKPVIKQQHKRNNQRYSPIPSDGKIKWIICGILGIITLIAFAPAFKNNFVNWDDNVYVLDNLFLQRPISECVNYFFTHFFSINYHPLTMIIYALEYHSALHTPGLYHEVNIIIHVLNVFMVFWFIYLLSDKKIEVATIVALFFGVHPMHVESVAWIAELKDVLFTFFFMGGLIAYYKFVKEKDKKKLYYFLTVILFILSGLSKPAAITFSLVLILIDYYLKRKNNLNLWLEKIPFFVISLVLGILTVKAQSASAIGNFEMYPLLSRFLFVIYGMMTYIGKFLLPINLSLLYPYPQGSLPVIYYITPVLMLLLFYFIYRSLKYTRIVLFGFLFFLANIILVLQFVSVGHAIIAERYTYVPYIGLLFILAMGFSWIYRNKDAKIKTYKTVAIVAVALLSLTSAYLTNARCQTWFNTELIWTNTLEQFPNVMDAYQNRGGYYIDKAKFDVNPGPNEIGKAFDDFNKGISIKQDNPKLYECRAYIYNMEQKFDMAIADYSLAIKLDPNDYESYLNRAISYSAMNKLDSAFLDYDKVLQLHGGDPMLYQNRGHAYFNTGKYKESADDFTNFIASGATVPIDIYFFRSYDYFKINKMDESLADINKVIEMKPDYRNGNAYFSRSMLYKMANKFQLALDDALKAQSFGYQVDPNYIAELKKSL